MLKDWPLIRATRMLQVSATLVYVTKHRVNALIRREARRPELAQKAFNEFHALCFWSDRPDAEITEDKIPFVVRGLREHEAFRATHQI